MIALLLNHLWQSSLCLAGAGLLALALRRNGANVRFWLWFAASVKFLLPFALLTVAGTYYLKPVVPPQPAVALIEPLVRPFSAPAMAVTAPVAGSPAPAIILTTAEPVPAPAIILTTAKPVPARWNLESALLAVWLAGFLIVTLHWLVRWWGLRTLLRDAVAVQVDAPIAVKFSTSLLEPGLAGIIKPVILLPQGIEQQLSPVELKAVLAHELCHWRRHDNLLASIHMLVEALFWFFPPVWWLGARLNAERERACDESVLAEGNDPQEYAEGILKVCRAYLQSPLACVAGVSGGGLKARIDAIMENRLVPQLNAVRKLVLSASAALVIAVPLALGLATVPVAQIQAKAAQVLAPIAQITAPAATTSAPPNEATPSQTSALPVVQPESLTPPSPDLSGALPNEALATPIVVASNDPRTANDQPAAPPATQDESTANTPHPKTEAGIRCLLGLGPDGCETVFANPDVARRSIDIFVNVPLEGGGIGNPWGVLESIEYLGTNADGNDVYSVKFMHRKLTYLLPQPGPDGKIATRCRFDGPPAGAMYGQCLGNGFAGPLPVIARTSAMKVTSPAPRILYTRATERSDLGGPAQAAPQADAVTGKTLDPTRTIRPHAETARAMLCLLGADPNAPCRDDFWGPARFGAIHFMGLSIGQRNFDLGPLVSAEYVYTQSQNAYTTSALNGRTADVYYVKFEHQDRTYYIARPDPDGKIHIWFARNGAPEDEKTEPVGMSRVR